MELKDLQEELKNLKEENARLIKSNNEVITKLNEKEASREREAKLKDMKHSFTEAGGNPDLWNDYLKVNEPQLLKGELNTDTKWAFNNGTDIAGKIEKELKEPEPEPVKETTEWIDGSLSKVI